MPEEDEDQFLVFKAYRDLPPENRSVENLPYKAIAHLDDFTAIFVWEEEFRWRERAKAYDEHEEAQSEFQQWQTPISGESSKAFSAFEIYRDLGVNRSRDRAYCVAKGYEIGTKSAPGTWANWCSRFHWVSRAQAYDAFMSSLAQHQDRQKWCRRRAEQREKEYEAGTDILKRADEMLRTLRITSEDNRIDLPMKWWVMGDAIALHEVGMKLTHNALDQDQNKVLNALRVLADAGLISDSALEASSVVFESVVDQLKENFQKSIEEEYKEDEIEYHS